MTDKPRAGSLEEARDADVAAARPEPAAPETTPEPPETLEEEGHWCLHCTDPGVIRDPLGNWWCETGWAQREQRLAGTQAAIREGATSRRRDREDRSERIDPDVASQTIDRVLTRFTPPPPERRPYQDD